MPNLPSLTLWRLLLAPVGLLACGPPTPPGLIHGDFATAATCGECHSATATTNVDEGGRPVGLHELWSVSAMANAALDPLFRAALANEIARAPGAADAIATTCLTCHAGLGRHSQKRAGFTTTLDLLYSEEADGVLARDGVSCTLCHQIEPANLGTDSSFSGGYELSTSKRLAGPYPSPFTRPMVNRIGFTPFEGAHIQSSALCGTCHTLVTEAITPAGIGTGHHMGEQLTYLEWRRSAFTTEGGGATPQSCQDCHMPDRREDGQPLFTRLAHRPDGSDFDQVSPRGPFSRHGFAGANTLLPKLLRAGRASLQPIGNDAALLAAEESARDVLRSQTARLTIGEIVHSQGVLTFTAHLENLVGHKFPSGYPSRRAFLHVRVQDPAGVLLFESGAVDEEGRLIGPTGEPLGPELQAGGFHPHRTLCTNESEVAVYESVMDDGLGGPAFELLAARGYVKDNRLLPKGHVDVTTGPQSTAAVGVSDDDFRPGFDDVHFALPLSSTPGRVEVRLLYQTFSPRYLDELLVRNTPQAASLRSTFDGSMLRPERVAEALVSLK